MQTMAAGEFKAKCLGVIDEVKATGKTVIITKRGILMARLLPLEEQAPKESPESIFGCLRGFITSTDDLGNLVEPIIPLEEWDHLKEDWSPFPPE